MIILGIGGGIDLINERKYFGKSHDAAAVLIKNGKEISAIEEERLNRIKHTNKIPLLSIQFCLNNSNVSLQDVDYIAVFGMENYYNSILKQRQLQLKN